MENDELAQHLDSLKREDCYRVDAVLKQSAHETTQRVYFVGENGAETGPYIRKFILQTPNMGAVYERIYEAQRNGRRFKYLPDILECYARNGHLVVVMEYVRGETLQDAVYRLDPSLGLATNIFPRLCDAASELHEEFDPPIIHRDLKPSNVVLSSGGLAIIDFGIAREFKDDSDSDTSHFGTRGFAPPEQFGFGQTTVRSDIYSLGMVLYYCLTETMPDNAMRERGFADPRIPASIRQVIIRATAFDPQYRFASAAELKWAFLEAVEQAERASDDKRAVGATGVSGVPGAVGMPDDAGAAGTAGPMGAGSRASATSNATGNAAPALAGEADANTWHKNRRPIAVLAAALALCVVVAVAFALGSMNASTQSVANQSSTSQQANGEASSQSVSSADADTDSADASSADADTSNTGASGTTEESEAVAQAAETVSINAPKKNAYDPATNFTVTVAGVEYQVPRYFKTKTMVNGAYSYYYAETGSSTALLMTAETAIGGNLDDEDIFSLYDDYLEGIGKGNETFNEVAIVADCDLAGYPARIATFTGAVKGIPSKSEVAFFYNPSVGKIGTIMFGQTENAQFDYQDDFAKVITSATPHK